MSKNKLDIVDVIESGLNFDSYFILYCLYYKKPALLVDYIKNCNKIELRVYRQLAIDGYLSIDVEGDKFFYNDLTLLDKGRFLFGSSVKDPAWLTTLFEEFRNNYPSSVKEGYKVRRLHKNLDVCKKLYCELLDETTHEVLCKAARMYAKEQKLSGPWFTQLLETWLRQKGYKPYEDEPEEPTIEGGGLTHDI